MPLFGDVLHEVKGQPALVRALHAGALGLAPDTPAPPAVVSVVQITIPAWEAVTPQSGGEQLMTAAGVAPGDFVAVAKPAVQAGLGIAGARVSAQDTIAVTWLNSTLAALTPSPGEVYSVLQVRASEPPPSGSLEVGAEAPVG